MNYLDGYVEEVLSEPYYDDYGSGIFRWWVEVSYICECTESTTTLMFDTREEAEVVKPGYKFLNNMEKNLKLVCPKCGTPHQPHSPHTMDADGFERCEIRTIMEDRGWCYECSFWQNMYDKHKDDPGWVRIDGESWVLKPMVENVPSGWNSLGCGGRKMYINIEGKGIVVSNNCWCQGDVSDAFKDLMPDNATWATKEEFDKAPVVGYIVEGIGLVFTDRGGHEVNA